MRACFRIRQEMWMTGIGDLEDRISYEYIESQYRYDRNGLECNIDIIKITLK